MADSKSTSSAHPLLRLSPEQREAYFNVARTANFEVYQLGLLLRETIANSGMCWEGDLASRGICTRLMELSDIVNEACFADDVLTDLNELHRRLGVQEASRG